MPLLIVALAIVAPRAFGALVAVGCAIAVVETIAEKAAERAIAKNARRPA